MFEFIKQIFYYSRRPGSRLNSIIDVTGASQYHGFLPVLVRNCIASLTSQQDFGQTAFKNMKLQDEPATGETSSDVEMPNGSPPPESGTTTATTAMDVTQNTPTICAVNTTEPNKFPVSLTTALFSFLYHLASYDVGGEALVSCGMMESLLQVINWQGYELDHITVSYIFICVYHVLYFLSF